MKKIITKIIDLLEAVNRGRAAAHFTRMGRTDLAREILLKD